MSTTEPDTAHLSAWDKAAVVALGAAGCALSYDALRQMAFAIHVRSSLTWLFPIVIDGFIAYGVRALLVLKHAPLRARLYAWALFGTATAASIWANALHAVRLNEQVPYDGLRLGDTVVAILSTIAPLALAGAVHLYILIARSPDTRRPTATPVTGHSAETSAEPDTRTVTGQPDRPELTVSDTSPEVSDNLPTSQDKRILAEDTPGQRPDTIRIGRDTSNTLPLTGLEHTDDLLGQPSLAELGKPVLDRDTEALLEIAREAVRAEDKLTRKVVAEAIRGQQIPLSNDNLTTLMNHLRQQHGQPVTASRT